MKTKKKQQIRYQDRTAKMKYLKKKKNNLIITWIWFLVSKEYNQTDKICYSSQIEDGECARKTIKISSKPPQREKIKNTHLYT